MLTTPFISMHSCAKVNPPLAASVAVGLFAYILHVYIMHTSAVKVH